MKLQPLKERHMAGECKSSHAHLCKSEGISSNSIDFLNKFNFYTSKRRQKKIQAARIYEKSNWIIRMHHITVFQSHSCHTGSWSENFLCFTTYYMYFALQTIPWNNWKYPQKCSKNKIRKWAYVVGFGAQQWEEVCWYCCTSGQIVGSGKNGSWNSMCIICLQLYVILLEFTFAVPRTLSCPAASMYIFPAVCGPHYTDQILFHCTCCFFSAPL